MAACWVEGEGGGSRLGKTKIRVVVLVVEGRRR